MVIFSNYKNKLALICKIMSISLLICLSGRIVLADQNLTTLSLNQAVELGLKTNPEFSSSVNNKYVVDQRLMQARALYLPSINLSAEAGYETTDTPSISSQEQYRRQVSLGLSQLLFDGFGTVNEIKRQKALLKTAEHRMFETSEFVSLSIVNSFLNVLRRRELLAVAKGNITDHDRILERIKDGAENGKFNLGDLAQIKSRVARAQANFETVEQSLSEADASYQNTIGAMPVENLQIALFPAQVLPLYVDEFITQSKELSPTLATFQSDINAADAEYQVSKSSYLPNFNLELEGSRGTNLNGTSGDDNRGAALVVMNWNLFRGGADKARVKEAFHQKSIAHDAKTNAVRALENNIRDTWAAKRAASNQLKAFKNQVSANTKVVEVYQDQFKLNRRSLLDMLNAQNELFISKSNKINAYYSEMFAGYRLLALGGGLLTALGVDRSGIIPEPRKTAPEKQQKEKLKIALEQIPEAETGLILNKLEPVIKGAAKEESKEAPKEIEQTIPVKSQPVKTGTYIQLGSYLDIVTAEKGWDIFVTKNADLMKDLEKNIEYADLGDKGVYYRLQAGPMNLSQAKNLCRDLNKQNAGGCIIVR